MHHLHASAPQHALPQAPPPPCRTACLLAGPAPPCRRHIWQVRYCCPSSSLVYTRRLHALAGRPAQIYPLYGQALCAHHFVILVTLTTLTTAQCMSGTSVLTSPARALSSASASMRSAISPVCAAGRSCTRQTRPLFFLFCFSSCDSWHVKSGPGSGFGDRHTCNADGVCNKPLDVHGGLSLLVSCALFFLALPLGFANQYNPVARRGFRWGSPGFVSVPFFLLFFFFMCVCVLKRTWCEGMESLAWRLLAQVAKSSESLNGPLDSHGYGVVRVLIMESRGIMDVWGVVSCLQFTDTARSKHIRVYLVWLQAASLWWTWCVDARHWLLYTSSFVPAHHISQWANTDMDSAYCMLDLRIGSRTLPSRNVSFFFFLFFAEFWQDTLVNIPPVTRSLWVSWNGVCNVRSVHQQNKSKLTPKRRLWVQTLPCSWATLRASSAILEHSPPTPENLLHMACSPMLLREQAPKRPNTASPRFPLKIPQALDSFNPFWGFWGGRGSPGGSGGVAWVGLGTLGLSDFGGHEEGEEIEVQESGVTGGLEVGSKCHLIQRFHRAYFGSFLPVPGTIDALWPLRGMNSCTGHCAPVEPYFWARILGNIMWTPKLSDRGFFFFSFFFSSNWLELPPLD